LQCKVNEFVEYKKIKIMDLEKILIAVKDILEVVIDTMSNSKK
jgi:hypothetical protein